LKPGTNFDVDAIIKQVREDHAEKMRLPGTSEHYFSSDQETLSEIFLYWILVNGWDMESFSVGLIPE